MTTKVISVSRTSGKVSALSGSGRLTILGTTRAWKASTSGYTAMIETSHIFQRGGGFIVGTFEPGSWNQVSRPVSCCSPWSASISSSTPGQPASALVGVQPGPQAFAVGEAEQDVVLAAAWSVQHRGAQVAGELARGGNNAVRPGLEVGLAPGLDTPAVEHRDRLIDRRPATGWCSGVKAVWS